VTEATQHALQLREREQMIVSLQENLVRLLRQRDELQRVVQAIYASGYLPSYAGNSWVEDLKKIEIEIKRS
jgi:hypothetical protein